MDIGITRVLFPASPGTLCSLGLLMADAKFDLCRSLVLIAEKTNIAKVAQILSELAAEGDALLNKEKIAPEARSYIASIECRYERQNYEISIETDIHFSEKTMDLLIEDFHKEHQRSYGYQNKKLRLQMVNYRISAVGRIRHPKLHNESVGKNVPLPAPTSCRPVLFDREQKYLRTPIYQKEILAPGCELKGPAIIEQMDSTSVIPPGWKARIDGYRNIIVVWEKDLRK
jgi:N-methylhydantoinase A